MIEKNHVAVFDFGSQYTQLIVRRVRELGFFAKLYEPEEISSIGEPGAIIWSGGPKSTSDEDAPDIDFEALDAFGVPVSRHQGRPRRNRARDRVRDVRLEDGTRRRPHEHRGRAHSPHRPGWRQASHGP